VGDLFTALRRHGLIADELVLQVPTLLRWGQALAAKAAEPLGAFERCS
jgi:hypothetical protein